MSCERVQNRLGDLLDGRLDGETRREVERHVAECASCGGVYALLRLGSEAAETAPTSVAGTPDLSGTVLERTTGSACARAHEILCDHVDGALGALDRGLLELHLGTCRDCAALDSALVRLGEDLPAMAELQPGPAFTARVLDATLPRPSRWAAVAARCSRAFGSLLARPRIAWEAGYVGAMAVWAFIGLFGAPFQASSIPLLAPDAPTRVIREVQDGVGVLGQKAWDSTARRGMSALDGFRDDLGERFRRTEPSLETLRQKSRRMKQAASEWDFEQRLQRIEDDARSAWQRLTGPAAAEPAEERSEDSED